MSETIALTYNTLFTPGDVCEVRAILANAGQSKHYQGWSSGIVSGYFDNAEDLALWCAPLDAAGICKAIYITLNPVLPSLLGRANNCLKGLKRGDPTTSDEEISARNWLMIDLDPIRPAGISSNQTELDHAHTRAQEVMDTLATEGWPTPVTALSGNGFHLLYRISYPNDDSTATFIKNTLDTLSDQFSDNTVNLDRTVFNASRGAKLYGTTARKGDTTPDRPHRQSALIETLSAGIEAGLELESSHD